MWRVFLRMALVCVGLWAGWQAGAWVSAQPADAQYSDAPREQVADTSLSVAAENPDTSTDDEPSSPLMRRPDRFLMWGAGAVLMIMHELREAAAQLHADMLLIYTFDTAFTADDHAEPLTIVTLGLFPAMNIRLHTTATAVLMDTRNGYIYATVIHLCRSCVGGTCACSSAETTVNTLATPAG